jgi:hypothetical protein
MGIGFNPNPFPAQGPGNNTPVNPQVRQALSHEGFQQVLEGLGISPKDIQSIGKQDTQAAQMTSVLQDMHVIQTNAQQTQMLQSMGLVGAELVIALQASEELDKIRERLDDIEESIQGEAKEALLKALGLPSDVDAVIINDGEGGVVIIQRGLDELEQSTT